MAGGWASREESSIYMHGVRHFFYQTFLGTFAELRKATFSFVMSVRKEQLGSHWKNFH